MKEILEKIEELKKMGVSVKIQTISDFQYGNYTEEFDEFRIHPSWDEDTLSTELIKKYLTQNQNPGYFI